MLDTKISSDTVLHFSPPSLPNCISLHSQDNITI
ncbi:hypothetical protein AAZX31_16G124100 [Glycine max]